MSYGLRDLDGMRVELGDECGFDEREARDLATAFAPSQDDDDPTEQQDRQHDVEGPLLGDPVASDTLQPAGERAVEPRARALRDGVVGGVAHALGDAGFGRGANRGSCQPLAHVGHRFWGARPGPRAVG